MSWWVFYVPEVFKVEVVPSWALRQASGSVLSPKLPQSLLLPGFGKPGVKDVVVAGVVGSGDVDVAGTEGRVDTTSSAATASVLSASPTRCQAKAPATRAVRRHTPITRSTSPDFAEPPRSTPARDRVLHGRRHAREGSLGTLSPLFELGAWAAVHFQQQLTDLVLVAGLVRHELGVRDGQWHWPWP